MRRIFLFGAIPVAALATVAGISFASAQTDSGGALPDSATTAAGTPVTVAVLANDVDSLGTLQPNTVSVISGPSNGTTTVDSATGNVTYMPAAGFTGTDEFTYLVCDDQSPAFCDSAVVTITVGTITSATPTATTATPTIPDAPIATADDAVVQPGSSVKVNVLANDTGDVTGLDPATLAIVAPPANGVATVGSSTITYTPAASFTGVDSVTYQVCDMQVPAVCAQGVLTITVAAQGTPVPSTPEATTTEVPSTPAPVSTASASTPTPEATTATEPPTTLPSAATPAAAAAAATPAAPSTGSGSARPANDDPVLFIATGLIAAAAFCAAGYGLARRRR